MLELLSGIRSYQFQMDALFIEQNPYNWKTIYFICKSGECRHIVSHGIELTYRYMIFIRKFI